MTPLLTVGLRELQNRGIPLWENYSKLRVSPAGCMFTSEGKVAAIAFRDRYGKSDFDYLYLMHELGHAHTMTPLLLATMRLEMAEKRVGLATQFAEVVAWQWAKANVVAWTPEFQQDAESALASYGIPWRLVEG